MKTQSPITGLIFPSLNRFTQSERAAINLLFLSLEPHIVVWIYHKEEEYEKKEHIHFAIVPNGRKFDVEKFVLSVSKQDLHCMPPRKISSDNLGDWVCYVLHDQNYLAYKGMSRVFHYNIGEFHGNYDEAYLSHLYYEAMENISIYSSLFELVRSAPNMGSLLKSGKVNPSNLSLVKEMYRETHSV